MQVGARWKYWMMFLILGLANIGDATEYASIGFLLADKDFQHDILNDNTKRYGFLASVAFMGPIIGGLVLVFMKFYAFLFFYFCKQDNNSTR